MERKLSYTVINQTARISLGLTLIDYCVADTIHHLAYNPNNDSNWCYASKDYIADYLIIGRRTVFRAIDELLARGLIEKNQERPELLRTTKLWFDSVMVQNANNGTDSVKMALPQYQNGTPNSAEMALNNNIYNKNNKKKKGSELKEDESKQILSYWNEVHGTSYSSVQGIVSNVTFWLNEYTLDQIKTAIRNIKNHDYWNDKMSPPTLFRRKNPRGENVDYIGEMLNVKTVTQKDGYSQMGYKIIK